MRIHDYRLEIWYVNLLQVQGFHLWLKLCMHIYSKLWRVMKWRASGSLGLRSRLEGYQLNGETCIVRYCMFCWSCSCKNAKVWEYGDPNLQDVSYGVIFTPFLESFSTSTDSSTTCRNEVLFFFPPGWFFELYWGLYECVQSNLVELLVMYCHQLDRIPVHLTCMSK